MANIRQYIGARYVFKIYENSTDPSSAEWESGVTYEPLTIVTYLNSTYASKKDVPATVGNPASNPTYWVVTGAYNGQILELQRSIAALNDTIEEMDEKRKYYIDLESDNAQNIIDTTNYDEYVLCNGNGNSLQITITRPIIISGENCTIDGTFTIESDLVTIQNINFVTENKVNAILVNQCRWLNITDCFFSGYDKAIMSNTNEGTIDPNRQGDSLFHNRALWNIIANKFTDCNYCVYGDYNTDNSDPVDLSRRWMRNSDWTITGNYVNIAKVTAFWFRGIDGCTISNNTIFLSSTRATCKHGIEAIDKTNYFEITDNKIFECGEEAIKLDNVQWTNICNNNIAWCGYYKESCAIEVSSSTYGFVNICDNLIDSFTGSYAINVPDAMVNLVISNNTINLAIPPSYSGSIPSTREPIYTTISTDYIVSNNMCTPNKSSISARQHSGALIFSSGSPDALTQIGSLPMGFYILNANGANHNDVLQLPEAKHMVLTVLVFNDGFIEVDAQPLNEDYKLHISCYGGTWSSWMKTTYEPLT